MPRSPVRPLTTSSTGVTQTLPSPIFPVRAAATMASTTLAASISSTSTSSLIFGRNSTVYSAPRYTSVWPFCRPYPCTSPTVMPVTPRACSASLTASSWCGLITAVTSFIFNSSMPGKRYPPQCQSTPGAGCFLVGYRLLLHARSLRRPLGWCGRGDARLRKGATAAAAGSAAAGRVVVRALLVLGQVDALDLHLAVDPKSDRVLDGESHPERDRE